MRRGFGSGLLRIHGVDLALNHAVVDGILYERNAIRNSPESRRVAVVFGKEKVIDGITEQVVIPERGMMDGNYRDVAALRAFAQRWFDQIAPPTPGVANPNRRQQM